MKSGFNEGSDWDCKDHSVMKDLECCEKYGYDYIDIQNACLDRDLASGKCTLKEIGNWLSGHRLRVSSYNAVCDYNMHPNRNSRQEKKDELKLALERSKVLGTDIIILVPRADIEKPATRKEIREDSIELLQEMAELAEPYQIRLAVEFCGQPTVSINQFGEAYAIVQAVSHPLIGMVFDQYHFEAMGSSWQDFEKADGKKIFVWHFNDTEDLPCGAAYNTYSNRLWPGDPRGSMDMERYVSTLKKIGYQEGICTLEVFRPEYYALSQEENVRLSKKSMDCFLEKYCKDFN